jgi:hypothetical protein
MRKVFVGVASLAITTALSYGCAVGNGDGERPEVGAVPTEDARASAETGGRDATAAPGSDAGDGSASPLNDAGSAVIDAGTDGTTSAPSNAGSFMVVRVGAVGGAALSAAAAPVFIEQRRIGDGVVEKTLAMPIAAAGAQNAFTLRGTSTTEGALSLSGNGAYVALAGYAAAPGTADVAATPAASTARVVARVSSAGTIDTSTVLAAAFDGKSVRAATSADGTAFWVSGENGANATGGIYYVAQGATAGTQLLDAPQNLRVVSLFGGQLYASTQSGAGGNTLRLFSVGTGLPTTAGQAGAQLPGLTDATTTPHGFALLDLDPAVAGVDTMYVADTRALASGGGIQKWKLAAGGAWTLAATFKSGLTDAPVNVAAKRLGTSVAVLCVTLDNPAKIVRFLDDGVNVSPSGTTLAVGTATFVQYRGVALAP